MATPAPADTGPPLPDKKVKEVHERMHECKEQVIRRKIASPKLYASVEEMEADIDRYLRELLPDPGHYKYYREWSFRNGRKNMQQSTKILSAQQHLETLQQTRLTDYMQVQDLANLQRIGNHDRVSIGRHCGHT